MRKNAFVAMNHIAALNQFKKYSLQYAGLSRENIQNAFKDCGIPSNSLFFSEFLNSELLVKINIDTYIWRNKFPIHHSTLQDIYTQYQKRVNEYQRDAYNKKREVRVSKAKEIQNAIQLLKENGYEILIPSKGFYKKILIQLGLQYHN